MSKELQVVGPDEFTQNWECTNVVRLLSELLDNEELKVELPKPIIKILQKHYKNWGGMKVKDIDTFVVKHYL